MACTNPLAEPFLQFWCSEELRMAIYARLILEVGVLSKH